MKIFFNLFTLLIMNTHLSAQQKTFTYLALGDSYTIGESVPIYENFPYQTVQMLRKNGIRMHAAEIVAKTGWTTDELMKGIQNSSLNEKYDWVSLLIGVNNQYRGRTESEYEIQFRELLDKAVAFAGGKTKHVFVLSIPDWGATPFAQGRDRAKIGVEIDRFNAINRAVSKELGVHYIDITPYTREALSNTQLVAGDKLHPSGKDYLRWAASLAKKMQDNL